jgi:hypothetical protein
METVSATAYIGRLLQSRIEILEIHGKVDDNYLINLAITPHKGVIKMGNGDDDIMDKRRHHAAISERVASFAELDDAFDALAAIAPKRAPSRREWLAAISSPRDAAEPPGVQR